MNIQLTLDFEVDIPEAKKTDILNQAYMLKYYMQEQMHERIPGEGFKKLLDAYKSTSIVVRD